MPKIVCIIQARTGSARLPNKIFLPLQGKPLLFRVIDRMLESELIGEVAVATTTKENDQKIIDLLVNYNSKVYATRGSEDDVLDRYYQAAKQFQADIIVRITSDNPLIDPDLVDRVINEFLSESDLDYASTNIGKHTFPRGTDVEAISFSTLEKIWQTTTEPIDREHVTIHIKRFPENFKIRSIQNKTDLSFHRWTVDEEADYKFVSAIYDRLYPSNPHFRMKDVLELLKNNPELMKINKNVEQRNPKY